MLVGRKPHFLDFTFDIVAHFLRVKIVAAGFIAFALVGAKKYMVVEIGHRRVCGVKVEGHSRIEVDILLLSLQCRTPQIDQQQDGEQQVHQLG